MKNWKKFALGGTSLAVAALALAGCSSSSTNSSGKTPTVPLPTAIQTLDSTMVTDSYSMDVIGNTMEGLVRATNGQPTLALAQSIKSSNGGKTWTITLKPNLKWSNGDKLTAADFVYSWQRAVNPKTASQYAYIFTSDMNLENAAKVNSQESATQADLDSIGIKATSDTKFVVTLSSPTPYFENLLALPVTYPEDKAVVEKDGTKYGTNSTEMVYDGPFYFKPGASGGWNGSNNNLTVEKNPNYWDAKSVVSSKINFQVVSNPNTQISMWKSGKLDWAGIGSSTLYPLYKDNKDEKSAPVSENEYIEFNQSGKGTTSPDVAKALQNVNIRKALVLATDRQGVINAVSPSNKVATGFTPTGTGEIDGKDFSVYAKQPYKYDVSEAKTYWEKGLKELGLTSLNISIESDSDSPSGKQNLDFLQKDFETALPGLTITEKLVPFQQRLKDSQNGNFDMVVSLWGGDYSEPSTFMSLFIDGSSYNNGKFVNAAYQTAMKKATGVDAMNTAKRYADYKDAEKALYDEASVDPVEFYSAPYVQNPKLKGVVWNATGLTFDMKKAYISK